MATDFFEQQDRARRMTLKLVVMLVVAVVCVVVAVYAAVAGLVVLIGGAADAGPASRELGVSGGGAGVIGAVASLPRSFTDPRLMVWVPLGTLVVIVAGTLFKLAEIGSSGGAGIAARLGGRLLTMESAVGAEKRALNVVEEMAIASGVPVPPVYVMDREAGINAFAAGFRPSDAVIGLTRGTIERLTREELQGVVAHEFSHILNGDMRLNLRLIGLLHGILAISLVGAVLFRVAAHSGSVRTSRSDRGAGALPLAFLGLGVVLYVLGSVGSFFGSIIRAMISRQREFLADASAVQFTRNPAGIAGALKVIGGMSGRARVNAPGAGEASHMFFGQAVTQFGGLLATHPPLETRIRRLDPSWDGKFERRAAVSVEGPATPGAAGAGATRDLRELLRRRLGDRAAGLPVGFASAAGVPEDVLVMSAGDGAIPLVERSEVTRTIRIDHGPSITRRFVNGVEVRASGGQAGATTARVGAVSGLDAEVASAVLESLPAAVGEAAREPFAARAVVLAMLLDRRDEGVRDKQWTALDALVDAGTAKLTRSLVGPVAALPRASRLPVLELAASPLRQLTREQRAAFVSAVHSVVRADGRVELFEWVVQTIVLSGLEASADGRPSGPRHQTISGIEAPLRVVLSTLAHAGTRDAGAAAAAFGAGASALGLRLPLMARAELNVDALGPALREIAQGVPAVQRRVMSAFVACATHDRAVTAVEAELIRAFGLAIGLPVPITAGASSDAG